MVNLGDRSFFQRIIMGNRFESSDFRNWSKVGCALDEHADPSPHFDMITKYLTIAVQTLDGLARLVG